MNKKQLLYIIDRADRWYVDDDGGFIACEDDDDIEHQIDAADLKKVHQHLPFALTALIDWSLAKRIKEFGRSRRTPDYELAYAEHDLVEATVELLESGGYRFIDTGKNTVLMSKITEVHLTSASPEYLPLTGYGIEVNHTCVDNERIPFVVKTKIAQVVLDIESLETQYPGALNRFLIGQDLGIEHDALMRHVFTTLRPSHTPMGLDKVDFA